MHICRENCCRDADEAREKASDLMCTCLLRPIAVPALNKWTKVFPCVGACVLLSSFSDSGPTLFKHLFGKQDVAALSELDSSGDEEDEALNVPINEVKRWIKLAKKRNAKAANFLCDENCRFVNLLWLHIAAPCMKLHWVLFKHATWYSDRKKPRPEAEADADLDDEFELTLGKFCVPAKNPGLGVLEELYAQLQNPNDAFRLICFFFGRFSDWPQARKRIALRSILITMGQLVRKVIEPFLAYPWKLYSLGDSDAELGDHARILSELFEARACCLDSGFSARLRALLAQERPEGEVRAPANLSQELREFLHVLFERVVLTSTFVERKFSHFTHWTDVKGKGASLALLASKHITRGFRDIVENWKKNIDGPRSQSWKQRPDWCRKSEIHARLNGYHMFLQDRREGMAGRLRGEADSVSFLEDGARAWSELGAEEKAEWRNRAREANARKSALQAAASAAQQPDVPSGPWNLSSPSDKWPLSSELFAAFLESTPFARAKEEWMEVWRTWV